MKYVRFYGGNGYCGCDYEEYYEFDDNVSEESLEEISQELAYEYAESYEYVATGWSQPWETEDDEIEYYDNAHDEAGWVYCTKEEFEENTKE